MTIDTSVFSRVKLHHLCQGVEQGAVRALLESIARARGCGGDAEVAEFLDPNPKLVNPIVGLRDLQKGVERIVRALRAGENVTVFGDYDCDGVTSVAQFVTFFRAAGCKSYRVYIPDRFLEDYGLTIPAVEKCMQEQKPSLIIAVDCGSSSIDALTALKAQGVDVIVIDHHQVHCDCEIHPAFAHLNPKGDPGLSASADLQDGAKMSAAGLCYFVVEVLAATIDLKWDNRANLILAGLGTYVDVMPLIGTNRALVKHSLRLCNEPAIALVPGVQALLTAAGWGDKEVTDYTFGFILGPHLNASGRMEHAKASLQLLCAQRPDTAVQRTEPLITANQERRALQETIAKEALVQAEKILAASPDAKVLVLYSPNWHSGIVGIVAGKIKEKFGRPVIVMARLESGYWKGSGRSIPAIDIGQFVSRAVKESVITAGGGHAMACGVKMTDDQLPCFVEWVRKESSSLEADLRPTIEVVGTVDLLSSDEWDMLLEAAAPFGQGNPRPAILIESPCMIWGGEPAKRRDQTVFGIKAGLQTKRHKRLEVLWGDIEVARKVFNPLAKFNLISEFSKSEGNDGRIYYNWRVVHGESIEVNSASKTTSDSSSQ